MNTRRVLTPQVCGMHTAKQYKHPKGEKGADWLLFLSWKKIVNIYYLLVRYLISLLFFPMPLTSHRNHIDQIDQQIMQLLAQRMTIVQHIGQEKAQQ